MDTLRITSLIDRVFAAAGTQTSPNIVDGGCVGGDWWRDLCRGYRCGDDGETRI